jgi:hypothetical protein
MKKIAFIALLTFSTFIAYAQTREDMQTVLQQCLDLEDLQKYYHKQLVEGKHHLVIRDDAIVPAYLQVEKFGNPVLFLSIEQLFFWDIRTSLRFSKFEVTNNTAEIEFTCDEIKDVIRISFSKSNNDWIVKNKQIN